MPKGLSDLLGSPIAFRPEFVKITGSANAALFLSQCYYWSSKNGQREGWFYRTSAEWQEETGLTRREQEHVRTILRNLGFIEEKRAGVKGAVNYRIVPETVELAISDCTKPPIRNARKRQSEPVCMAENAISDCTKPPIVNGENRQSLYIDASNTTTSKGEEIAPISTTEPPAFRRPTRDQVVRYFSDGLGRPEEADSFFDTFEGRGWKTFGKFPVPIMDYQAEARKWIRNADRFAQERAEKSRGTPKAGGRTIQDFRDEIGEQLRSQGFFTDG